MHPNLANQYSPPPPAHTPEQQRTLLSWTLRIATDREVLAWTDVMLGQPVELPRYERLGVLTSFMEDPATAADEWWEDRRCAFEVSTAGESRPLDFDDICGPAHGLLEDLVPILLAGVLKSLLANGIEIPLPVPLRWDPFASPLKLRQVDAGLCCGRKGIELFCPICGTPRWSCRCRRCHRDLSKTDWLRRA